VPEAAVEQAGKLLACLRGQRLCAPEQQLYLLPAKNMAEKKLSGAPRALNTGSFQQMGCCAERVANGVAVAENLTRRSIPAAT
jgi:hypothetical protein